TSNWDNVIAVGSMFPGSFSAPVSNLLYGIPYYYRTRTTNAAGGGWAGSSVQFKVQQADVIGANGLLVSEYDTVQAGGNLEPLSLLQGMAPDNMSVQVDDINYYQAALVNAFAGITGGDSFSLLWEGWFIPDSGAGTYSFGMVSDNRGVIYLDLNDDGDFDDGVASDPGEKIRDGNCCASSVGTVVLENRPYRIAIAMQENGGGQSAEVRYGFGTQPFANLNFVNGTSGAFVQDYEQIPFAINNLPASNVLITNATLNADLVESNSVFHLTVYWGTTDATNNPGLWSNFVEIGWVTNGHGTYSVPIGGLTTGTTYYYTFRASNCVEDIWASPSASLKTMEQPLVDNGPGPTDIAPHEAVFNGTLVSGGVADVIFFYGLSDGGTDTNLWDHAISLGALSEGVFSQVASGLLYGVRYYYRTYATNFVGLAWAPTTETFKVLQPDLLSMSVSNGLQLWLRADAVGSNHNESVHAWGDSSGNSNDALQAVDTNQPTYVTNAVNGLPAVRFDGNDRLGFGNVNARTVFAVNFLDPATVNLDGLIGQQCCDVGIRRHLEHGWRNGTAAGAGDFTFTPGSSFRVNNALYAAEGVMLEGRWHILEAMRGGASAVFDVLGGYFNGRDLNGDVAEILVFDRLLSPDEANEVGSYLASKYGIGSTYDAIPLSGVTNERPTGVTQTTAELNGTLFGSGAVYDVTVYWGPTDGGTNVGAWSNAFNFGFQTNLEALLTHAVSGLATNSTYYYAFRATNCVDVRWSQPSIIFDTSLDLTRFSFNTRISFAGYVKGDTLRNFPALVILGTNVPNFDYSQFAYPTNGADLRFFDGGQSVELNYEIEEWNTNGLSYIWVQVPFLDDSNTCVYAFWGDASLTHVPPVYTTNGATWSEGYEAVWHLNRTNATGRYPDSTGKGHDGTPFNTVPVPGMAANGIQLNGADAYVGTGQSFLNNLSAFTLSCWANGNYDLARRGFVGQNDCLEFGSVGGATPGHIWSINGGGINAHDLPNFTWHQFVGLGDDVSKKLYYDGVEVSRGNAPQVNFGSSAFNVNIGGGGVFDAGGNFFDGIIDEVRISFEPKSSNWLCTAWLNMVSNAAFVTYDPVPVSVGVDLRLTKMVSTTNMLTETNLTYTLGVDNLGTNPAGGVVVTDSLPNNVVLISSVPPPAQTNGNAYIFNLGTLGPGASVSVMISATYTSSATATITNWAWVSTTDTEMNLANNMDSAVTLIPDSDGDGIANPVDPDDDNDGFEDCGELIAGTDPFDPGSFFWVQIAPVNQTTRLLTFPTAFGRTYRIEATLNLRVGPWFNAQTNIPGDGTIQSIPDVS
ncbi:MAG: DUF2341 domain-containing protein, partial [Verrucomicrobiota bacterium]